MIALQVFEEIENVLLLWFPASVMGVIIIALTAKIGLLITRWAYPSDTHRRRKSRQNFGEPITADGVVLARRQGEEPLQAQQEEACLNSEPN